MTPFSTGLSSSRTAAIGSPTQIMTLLVHSQCKVAFLMGRASDTIPETMRPQTATESTSSTNRTLCSSRVASSRIHFVSTSLRIHATCSQSSSCSCWIVKGSSPTRLLERHGTRTVYPSDFGEGLSGMQIALAVVQCWQNDDTGNCRV